MLGLCITDNGRLKREELVVRHRTDEELTPLEPGTKTTRTLP